MLHATFVVAKGGGAEIGPTKRGKGMKIMVIVDRHGLLLSVTSERRFRYHCCGQRFAGLLVTVVDVNALGLQIAQGLVLTDVWYWNMNDANRAWTKRWQVERPGKLPTYGQTDGGLLGGSALPEGRCRSREWTPMGRLSLRR